MLRVISVALRVHVALMVLSNECVSISQRFASIRFLYQMAALTGLHITLTQFSFSYSPQHITVGTHLWRLEAEQSALTVIAGVKSLNTCTT